MSGSRPSCRVDAFFGSGLPTTSVEVAFLKKADSCDIALPFFAVRFRSWGDNAATIL